MICVNEIEVLQELANRETRGASSRAVPERLAYAMMRIGLLRVAAKDVFRPTPAGMEYLRRAAE